MRAGYIRKLVVRGATVLAAVMMGGVAALAWLLSAGGQRFMTVQLESLLNDQLVSGRIEVRGLDIDLSDRIRLQQVSVISPAGDVLAAIEQVDIRWAPMQLWDGRVHVTGARLSSLDVDVQQSSTGSLDIIDLFVDPSRDHGGEPFAGLGIDIVVDRVELPSASVRLRDADGEVVFRADAGGAMSVSVEGSTVSTEISEWHVELHEPARVSSSLRLSTKLEQGDLILSELAMESEGSAVRLSGAIADVETDPQFEVSGTALPLSLHELGGWLGVQQVPIDVNVEAKFLGSIDDGQVSLTLDGADVGTVRGTGTVERRGEQTGWVVRGATTGINVVPLLGGDGPEFTLRGTFGASGDDLSAVTEGGVVFWAEGAEQVWFGEQIASHRIRGEARADAVLIEEFVIENRAGIANVTGEVQVAEERAALHVDATIPNLRALESWGLTGVAGAGVLEGPLRIDWSAERLLMDATTNVVGRNLRLSGFTVGRIKGPIHWSADTASASGEARLTLSDINSGAGQLKGATSRLTGQWSSGQGTHARVSLAGADGWLARPDAMSAERLDGRATLAIPDGQPPEIRAELDLSGIRLGPAQVMADKASISVDVDGSNLSADVNMEAGRTPLLSGHVVGALDDSRFRVENLRAQPAPDVELWAPETIQIGAVGDGDWSLDATLDGSLGKLRVGAQPRLDGGIPRGVRVDIEGLPLSLVAALQRRYLAHDQGFGEHNIRGTMDIAVDLPEQGGGLGRAEVKIGGLSVGTSGEASVSDIDARVLVQGDVEAPHVSAQVLSQGEVLFDAQGLLPVRWEQGIPAVDCSGTMSLDSFLAPTSMKRLRNAFSGLPAFTATASASLQLDGGACDPDARLVSTWRVPVGIGQEQMRVEVDATREGDLLKVWGAFEERQARRVVVEGDMTTRGAAMRAMGGGLGGVAPEGGGLAAWIEDMNIRVVPLGVPVGDLVEMLGWEGSAAGQVQGGVVVSGTPAQPELSGALMVSDGKIGSVELSEALVSVVPASGQTLAVQGALAFGRNGQLGDLKLDGQLPGLPALANVDEWAEESGLRMELRSAGMPLSLMEVASTQVTDVAGLVSVGGVVTGSVAVPQVNLAIALRDGALTHSGLGLRFSDMAADLRANGRNLTLSRFRLSTDRAGMAIPTTLGSGDGHLQAQGTARLGAGGLENIQLELTAQDLWVASRSDSLLRVGGELRADGGWPGLNVGGELAVLEGSLRFDERAFLDFGDLALDPSITVRRSRARSETEIDPPQSVWSDVNMDIGLDVHRGIRLRAAVPLDDSRGKELTKLSTVMLDADLASQELRLHTKDGDFVINGTVEIPRGDLTLMGTTFEVASGRESTLAFIKDDYLDPAIDIQAVKETRSYGTVQAHVTGAASEPGVVFENEDYPSETDIMSILLFGKPASDLSDSESQSGSEMLSTAIGMVARSSLNRAFYEGSVKTEIEVDEERFRVGYPISDRVFASFEYLTQSDDDEGTFEMTLEWLISRRLYAEVAGGDGGNSADLFWRWRF